MSDLNDRNVEQLSAYLDGALSERERATLEARLQAEPALRAELDSLRQTVALVRGLPRLRAPRSFALTPEQAGLAEQARRLPFYLSGAFSALSAAAAVALVALGGYLLLGAPAQLAPAVAPTLLEVAAVPTVPLPSQRLNITPLPTLAPASVQGADTYEAGRGAARAMPLPEAGGLPGAADEAASVYSAPALEAAPAVSAAEAQPTQTLALQDAPAVEAAAAPPVPASTPAPPLESELFEPALTLPLAAAALVAGGLALLLLAAITTLARHHRLARL